MPRITCHAELADGTQCDGLAAITAARFVYKHEIIDGKDERVLSEVTYAIDCPKCGKRMLHDRADSNELPSAVIQAAREELADRVQEEASRLSRSSGSDAFFVQLGEPRDVES